MSSLAGSSKYHTPCMRAKPLTEHTSMNSVVTKRGKITTVGLFKLLTQKAENRPER